MISVRFQANHSTSQVIQVYAPTTDTEETEVDQFYEDLQDLLELTPKKISFSLQEIRIPKQEVKRYLE